MTDKWREIPARDGYPGLVELTRGGRSVAAIGEGPRARDAVVAKMEGRDND